MEMIVRTHNLTKVYGQTQALKQVSMQINKGDIYGFIGENGAGKSTVIRIIAGLARPTEGSFELNEDLVNDLGKMAAVVETPAIHLNLTAVKNLAIQCSLLGITENRSEFISGILRMVGLDYLISSKKKAKDFSLGMKQRLGIAMALLSKPEFIILDEPMNGLDPVGIVEMRNLIIRLNKEQKITFLISSHILTELDKVATKYGFISKGVLVKEISSKELHDQSSSHLELTVSPLNLTVIAEVLKGIKYEISGEDKIIIYDHVESSNIVKNLVLRDVLVQSVNTVSQGIEDFYLETIGGKK